ncbi:MAG: hypothetical protein HY427_01875 [Candidatus Levybacteria bacterium]|nr:hypothetical protein [Candidatus Levybacteria bacterium]
MTTQDLKQIDNLLQKRLTNFATKDDLTKFATKDDLDDRLGKLKRELESKMGELGQEIIDAMNISTVSKKEFTELKEKFEEELQVS